MTNPKLAARRDAACREYMHVHYDSDSTMSRVAVKAFERGWDSAIREMEAGASGEMRAIRERCEAASPGPWVNSKLDAGDAASISANGRIIEGDNCGIAITVDRGFRADADFIANARADVPYLLAVAGALEARVKELEGALEREREVRKAERFAAAKEIYKIDTSALAGRKGENEG